MNFGRSSTAGSTSCTPYGTNSSTSRSSSTTRCGGRTARLTSATTSGPWTLPAPGGRRELDDAIGEIASTPLDRSRPLWEMYFVDGLANGRIAVVNKIHHALADGVAAANLLALGMDLTTEAQPDPESYDTDPAPTRGQLVRTAFRDHVRQIGTVPATVRYTAQGINRVRHSSRKLSPELTRPFTPPPSFMNHVLRPPRRFATATLSLADIKETKNKLDVSINDLVLAMSAGHCESCCCTTTVTQITRCWRRCR